MGRVTLAELVRGVVYLLAAGCALSTDRAVAAEGANMKRVATTMQGREDRWTFVGAEHPWKEREDGVMLPPIWKILGEADAPAYFKTYGAYADDLTREDYAFLSGETLGDVDLSVDFQIRYAAVCNMGVAFRAQDSRRMYCVRVEDMDRKGYSFRVSLWIQDTHGFGREIASGIVPHPETPDRIRQRGPRNQDDWIKSSHGWSTLRARAVGDKISVSIDGKEAFECRDATYAAGAVALIARWAVPFRNLRVAGSAAELPTPWRIVPGTSPRYVLPFEGRIGPYEVFPAVTQDPKGTIHVSANVGEKGSRLAVGIVRSTDGGRTWVGPKLFPDIGQHDPYGSDAYGSGLNPAVYAHKDGGLTCFVNERGPTGTSCGVARSTDGGQTWSQVSELAVSGRPFSKLVDSGGVQLYSPVQRLRDGLLLVCGYHYDTVPGGNLGSSADRLDRSFLLRSTDDGATWTGLHYISRDNFDNNECMIAELPDGRLQAFMRTLKAPSMWTSYSADRGLTWTPLTQSGVSAECPFVLGHSSGTILLGSRSCGIFLNVSPDGGKSWEVFRVSPCSGMMGMTELSDGRVLIVYHTGFRVPGRIRAQFLRVTPTGLEAVW